MKKQSKINILFAAVDIGFRISHYSTYIKKNYPQAGKVESFSKFVLPKEHYKTSYTYELPVNQTSTIKVYFLSFLFFIKALFTYNVFHFFSGETLLTRKLRPFELWLYRIFGKKVIMHFVGADIRSEKYLEEKRTNLIAYLRGEPILNDLTEKYQKKLIRDTRKYANRIIVSTPDLLEIIPEADYIPVFIDLNTLDLELEESNSNQKIKILHSPSGFHTKGSEYIHKVLNRIKERNKNIEIITPMLENKHKKVYALTRYELLETIKKVDIVIDQMLIGWYGLKTIEALSMGTKVVCYIEKDLEEKLFHNSPIINASVLDLEEKIYEAIQDIEIKTNRISLQQTQLEWVNKYHSMDAYKEYFNNLWFK